MGIMSMFGFGPKPEEIKAYLDAGATILDVRTPAEYAEEHIEGSVNIPLDTVPQNVEKIKKMGKVVAHCRSGARSGNATDFLKKQGVDILNGGGIATVQSILNS